MAVTWPEVPTEKPFKPKHGLPKLGNYKKGATTEFWGRFPKKEVAPARALVSEQALARAVEVWGCEDEERFRTVYRDLEGGADIGCRGNFRGGSVSRNAESSYCFGDRVTDAIADWLNKGFAAGPFDEDDVPAGAKVNSIMCRVKPDGAVRIILNMSAPGGFSVNDGIDPERFPTVMSSTTKWLEVLESVGRGCSICKIDWADAYKHIAVRTEDIPLQYFEWLGKYFVELCLIF
jgi:hypothetical protein